LDAPFPRQTAWAVWYSFVVNILGESCHVKKFQVLSEEAKRSYADGSQQLHVGSGQHRLALLYLIDAMCCSLPKNGQAAISPHVQDRLRDSMGKVFPLLAHHLVTPVNCEKVTIPSGMHMQCACSCAYAERIVCQEFGHFVGRWVHAPWVTFFKTAV
jgi:hypothetical protein